jgi:hypothetical protein
MHHVVSVDTLRTPGESFLEFVEAIDPIQALPPDPRTVGVMWYEMVLKPAK